jgi:hypothetical protein
MNRTLLASLALVAGLPQIGLAQGDCFPSKTSNEAQTFGIFSVPLAFAPVGIPSSGRGRVHVGLELSYLPKVSDAIATPTVCRPGKGPENTDLLFAAPRPRVTVGLGGGFAVEGSWTPPARINQVRASLFAAALSYDTHLGKTAGLTVRAHGSFGTIKAPITCPDKELTNQQSECFNGTRSDDSFKPNILGVEAMVHRAVGRGRVQPYLGAGYSRLMPRFQVNFTNLVGQLDNRKVEVDLDRLAFFGGIGWAASHRMSLSAELYSVPTDATTGRVAIRFGL